MKMLALLLVLLGSSPLAALAQDTTDSPQLTVYEFYAKWCPYCKAYKPILDDIAQQYADRVKVIPVDIDLAENKRLVSAAKLKGIPTVIIMNAQGQPLDRLTGLDEAKTLGHDLDDKLQASL